MIVGRHDPADAEDSDENYQDRDPSDGRVLWVLWGLSVLLSIDKHVRSHWIGLLATV
jgi:hypothetical protein